MHDAPTLCPICGGSLYATRLHCDSCDTSLEGQFGFGRWLRLLPEQLAFANVFIKRRGKIKDVEDELGISYPTVVARLNELIATMGFDVPDERPDEESATARSEQRQRLLDQVANGELTAGEAARLLRSL